MFWAQTGPGTRVTRSFPALQYPSWSSDASTLTFGFHTQPWWPLAWVTPCTSAQASLPQDSPGPLLHSSHNRLPVLPGTSQFVHPSDARVPPALKPHKG